MVSLAEFAKNRRTIPVVYFTTTIEVVYKPHEYTAAVAMKTHEQPVVEFLALMIDTWDLTDENGDAIAISEETLVALPMRLLQEMSTAIIGDARLGEAASS